MSPGETRGRRSLERRRPGASNLGKEPVRPQGRESKAVQRRAGRWAVVGSAFPLEAGPGLPAPLPSCLSPEAPPVMPSAPYEGEGPLPFSFCQKGCKLGPAGIVHEDATASTPAWALGPELQEARGIETEPSSIYILLLRGPFWAVGCPGGSCGGSSLGRASPGETGAAFFRRPCPSLQPHAGHMLTGTACVSRTVSLGFQFQGLKG